MAASNINVAVITGNLTRDPELRHTGSGTAVCQLGVACNGRMKREGEWQDKANFFDVTVFGAQGENCAQYLAKGRPVAIEGRLDWQSWEAKDGSGKRSKVIIIANSVQFLSSREQDDESKAAPKAVAGIEADLPASGTSEWGYGDSGTQASEEEIPF